MTRARNEARWFVGTVDDGRGGAYAIHCRTRRHARARIAEYATLRGYRTSQRLVELSERAPSGGETVIPAGSSRYSEIMPGGTSHRNLAVRT